MFVFHSDDGRILTPPKELKPLLKSAYPAFFKMLGHIRFFYVADEIWDGKTSLISRASGEQFVAVTLDDGGFYIHIGDNDFQSTTYCNKTFRRGVHLQCHPTW